MNKPLPKHLFLFLMFLSGAATTQTPIEIYCLASGSRYPVPETQIRLSTLNTDSLILRGQSRPDGFFHTSLQSGRPYLLKIEKAGYHSFSDTIYTRLQLFQFVAELMETGDTIKHLPEANNRIKLPRLEPTKAGATVQPSDIPPARVQRKPQNGYAVVLADLQFPIPEDALLYQAIPDLESGQCEAGNYVYYCAYSKSKRKVRRFWKKHMRGPYPASWVARLKDGILLHY